MVGLRLFSRRMAYLPAVLFIALWVTAAGAQSSFPLPPTSTSTALTPPFTGGPLLQSPGSGYGGAPSSDTVCISSGMFRDLMPAIPNLRLGYTYNVGPNVRMGRAWGDYVLPINLGEQSVVFGEAHGEFENFWKRPSVTVPVTPGFATTVAGTQERIDLSFGGGFRRVLSGEVLFGANAFYDTSRIFGKWYSSGGFGLEMVAFTPGGGAADLNFNYYGNLFSRGGFINAFRNRNGSYDLEAGYSQGLLNNSLDLRLKFAGYRFDVNEGVYGLRTGADLTTRDGLFAVKYEYGHDVLNGAYQSIGAQVNIGFQLENILSASSPITAPAPVFVNPRNWGWVLSNMVKRNWHQPTAVVLSRQSAIPGGGGGSGCDRVIAPFPLLGMGVFSNNLAFTAFPFTSLTPTGLIHVTVTLLNPAPAGLFISVAVIGDNNVTTNQGFIFATGGETSITIPLTTVAPQSLFIGAGTNPNHLTITVAGVFTNDGITSACIQFNQ